MKNMSVAAPTQRAWAEAFARSSFQVAVFSLVMSILSVSTADDRVEFFEKRIRPVLVARCYKCHSVDSGKQTGGLLLDSRERIRRGGESGEAVVPSDVDQSLLVQAIRYESFEMPPDGRLPQRVIADFVKWIEMGAVDPRGEHVDAAEAIGDRDATRDTHNRGAAALWSLRPLAQPATPDVMDQSWPRGEIDRFVLKGLERARLTPARDAAPLQICRRLYLTLTGLPPTLDQIDDFADMVASRGHRVATEQLVDALLASPHFGERWGRHWLDLARYSDTNIGSDQRPWTNAWLYRNYVIKRFNEDLAFDRFVLEQIAGDMLPASSDAARADQLVATGFLALATRDLSERDPFQIQLDGIDDALDTIGKSMLGLNIGCARCHDHKFDPIPAADYYAMAGILKSSWLTGIRRRTATFNGDELEKHSPTTPKAKLPGGELRATTVTEYPADQRAEKVADMAIHIAGSYRRLGEVVPRGFIKAVPVSIGEQIPANESGRLQLAEWVTSDQNPLTPRVIANRVWYWVVGRPLVESLDDFGTRGGLPTHPELLDWLAVRFRDRHAWRFKAMIREIVLSRTWQMESSTLGPGMALDPQDTLYWRMIPRRLEAEQLHDSLLALSAELDNGRIEQTLPEYEQENTTNTSTVRIAASTRSHRAVYFPIFRKDMPTDLDVLPLFNFPNPKFSRGRRESNTLPAQALFLWNSRLAHRAAERIADQLMDDSDLRETERAERLIRLLYVRESDIETITQLIRMKNQFKSEYQRLGSDDPSRSAWKRVIHTMLISNEFMFVG